MRVAHRPLQRAVAEAALQGECPGSGRRIWFCSAERGRAGWARPRRAAAPEQEGYYPLPSEIEQLFVASGFRFEDMLSLKSIANNLAPPPAYAR